MAINRDAYGWEELVRLRAALDPRPELHRQYPVSSDCDTQVTHFRNACETRKDHSSIFHT
jgi:hypothetical protein